MTVLETETYKAVQKAANKIINEIDNKKTKQPIDWEKRRWELFLTLLGKKMVSAEALYKEADDTIELYKKLSQAKRDGTNT